MDSAPTIVGHRLAKSYGTGAARIDVLRELSVEIFPGELTLCTGPSGSGKSTLLAALSGLLKPDAVEASLILDDGTVIKGISFGAQKSIAGEVVFNTGMVGYPEALTDPSYYGQILTFTFPLIGNYGIPGPAAPQPSLESDRVQVRGVIVCNESDEFSHWAAASSLRALAR